jgi:hypothetical protein
VTTLLQDMFKLIALILHMFSPFLI